MCPDGTLSGTRQNYGNPPYALWSFGIKSFAEVGLKRPFLPDGIRSTKKKVKAFVPLGYLLPVKQPWLLVPPLQATRVKRKDLTAVSQHLSGCVGNA